ncbi:sensor histidine kinase [Paenibacillus alginolyticus]|uniref:histidine kinase n=1 Tax=Paenibacillus alginolyticus TaxID=59839 RepID=A0ABT4GQT9_9BACL|nr:HAMP domain-containing sensor histidine kinase [Paenibacillus alginolyticus]MCY9698373.1 HAMP domain-containing histidine kinase [Paenibacillus alginolyticus]MEC0148939.1 HAMP domain-containing sensor histidine kinase [Paenibacillus alginolyticus]
MPFLKKRLSLQKRIVFVVTAVTVSMLSTMLIFDTISLNQSIREAYVSQISGMTIAINGRYEESRSVTDVQQIFDYIQYKNTRVLEMKLYDKQGLVLAASNRSEVGNHMPLSRVVVPKQDQTIVDRVPMAETDKPVVRLTAPLQEDGLVVGAVEVIFDSSEEAALLTKRTKLILIVGLIVAIVMSTLLWLILRRIVIRPLSRLREAALIVKQGGDLPKLQFKASPEIAEVSEAFNDMVKNLDERYHELQQVLNTLQVTQDHLVQSEKMGSLGNLVAGVSHEINTPIGIGVTAVSYLDQKTKEFKSLYETGKMKKSDLEQFLSITQETNAMVQSNLERASSLVRSFKQISVDQSVEVKRTFHLKEYLEGIISSLKPTLKKTRLRVDVYCDNELTLYTYPGALSQIITNLVMNSLNHAYTIEEEGSLTIRVEDHQDYIILAYTDDGKGMTQEVLDQIFDPFFTTSRGKGGTGLGMNIVYNLVTQSLNGTIDGSSTLGQGSLFTITIPKEEEAVQ